MQSSLWSKKTNKIGTFLGITAQENGIANLAAT